MPTSTENGSMLEQHSVAWRARGRLQDSPDLSSAKTPTHTTNGILERERMRPPSPENGSMLESHTVAWRDRGGLQDSRDFSWAMTPTHTTICMLAWEQIGSTSRR